MPIAHFNTKVLQSDPVSRVFTTGLVPVHILRYLAICDISRYLSNWNTPSTHLCPFRSLSPEARLCADSACTVAAHVFLSVFLLGFECCWCWIELNSCDYCRARVLARGAYGRAGFFSVDVFFCLEADGLYAPFVSRAWARKKNKTQRGHVMCWTAACLIQIPARQCPSILTIETYPADPALYLSTSTVWKKKWVSGSWARVPLTWPLFQRAHLGGEKDAHTIQKTFWGLGWVPSKNSTGSTGLKGMPPLTDADDNMSAAAQR